MSGEPATSQDSATATQPSDEEMRAAYEAELNRITSTDMILQTTVSLLNIGGRRLGLSGGADSHRDLDQVSDAIDGARALMPILERRMPNELGPMRDALAQLQMAYAREVQSARSPEATPAAAPEHKQDPPSDTEKPGAPGPAESSGRLWVPGR